MPELPEVETVVRAVRPRLEGYQVTSCKIFKSYDRVIQPDSIQALRSKLRGQKIKQVSRRAKYIILELSSGYLVIHLRMTGSLELAVKPPKYATFELCIGQENLYLNDVRKFGTVTYHQNLEFLNQKLGIEPLTKSYTLSNWETVCHSSSLGAKVFLLNQQKVAGLGNIYVDEALWAAKVHPLQQINQLTKQQSNRLFKVIPEILKKSIEFQGTTFINFYFDGAKSGNFQQMLKVFNQTGKKCKRCTGNPKAVIQKIKVAGRGTHLCPECQKIN